MKLSPSPMVACPTCSGSGTIPLSDALLETYKVLRRLRFANATQLTRKIPNVKHAAMCNRLSELHRLGLVERDGSRYNWTYFVKKQPRTT